MILELLKILDFNDSETKVYLSLIETEACSASQMSRRVEMPRTTVHSVLENLVEKGIASRQHKSNTNYYSPGKPENILGLVRREQELIDEKQRVAKEVVNLITPFFHKAAIHIPKMQFFEGQKGVENMLYANLPEWEESIAQDDDIIWGYQDPSFVKHYGVWLEHHWERMDKLRPEMKIHLFSSINDVEKPLEGKIRNRIIRVFPGGELFSSSVWLLGEFVVMIHTNAEPHYAFQLKDAAFASNIKSFIKQLWNTPVS